MREREAKILGTIHHEHVVAVYSFGVFGQSSPYLAMELVQGKTLSELLEERESLDWQQATEIGIQVCQGISAAHKAGIVHRDLKPQNIMLTNELTCVKVLDFGLSGLIDDPTRASQKLTQTGALIGSIHYMSPEVCSGQRADNRADIYALGCILYQCLSGRLPLDADNPIAMLHKHKTEMPPPLPKDSQKIQIPGPLEMLIFKAMQKDPSHRFQSMEEMADALELIKQGRGEELSLQNVQLGTKSQNYSMILALTGTMLLLSTIGLFAFRMMKNKPAPVIAHQARTKVDDLSERQNQQMKARKLLTELLAAKEAKRYHEAERISRKILQIIGRKYPREARTAALAYEDMAILDQMADICAGLPFTNSPTNDSYIQMCVDIFDSQNRGAIDRSRLAELFGIKARHHAEFTDWRDGSHSYYRAIRQANYDGQIELCNKLMSLMEAGSPRSTNKSNKLFLNMARAQWACANKQFDEAAKSLKVADDEASFNMAKRDRIDVYGDIFCMQETRKDEKAALEVLNKLEPLIVELKQGVLTEAFDHATEDENYRKTQKILHYMKDFTATGSELRSRLNRLIKATEKEHEQIRNNVAMSKEPSRNMDKSRR